MTQVLTRVLHYILPCFITLKTLQYKTEINLKFKKVNCCFPAILYQLGHS